MYGLTSYDYVVKHSVQSVCCGMTCSIYMCGLVFGISLVYAVFGIVWFSNISIILYHDVMCDAAFGKMAELQLVLV